MKDRPDPITHFFETKADAEMEMQILDVCVQALSRLKDDEVAKRRIAAEKMKAPA